MNELTIELASLAILLLFLRFWPRVTSVAVIGIALTGGYYLNRTFGLGGLGTIQGADKVGKATMRAAIYASDAEQGVKIADVPVPAYTESQVFIKVKAAALNPVDFKLIYPWIRHMKQVVIGSDVSGVVVSAGSKCSEYKPGDEVYGFATGSVAEYAVLPCNSMARKPKSLSFEKTAALPIAAATSYQAVDTANVTKGQNVLVIGASGGCGVFGVQVAKARGAKVTGICSTRNIELVKSLGADTVVDYTNKEEMAKLQSGGAVFDLVYDTVTSIDPVDPYYIPIASPLLKPSGFYAGVNGRVGDVLRFFLAPLGRPLGLELQDPRYHIVLLKSNSHTLEALTDLFDKGLMKDVPIDMLARLDSKDLLKAWDRLHSRRAVGKIVFTI